MALLHAAARLALLLAALAAVPAIHAQDMRPDALVEKITGEVLEAIRKDKKLQAGDRERARWLWRRRRSCPTWISAA